MNKKEAYREILEVIARHEETIKRDGPIKDISEKVLTLIELEEISELFGIEIKERYSSPDYINLLGFASIMRMGEKHGRTISWSDDGGQPDDELLYCLSFPCGPYTFSRDYPKESFDDFFAELASFGAKYRDTANHCLYFTHEKAKTVHDAFDGIFAKHKAGVGDELRKRKIKALQQQLQELEGVVA